MAPEVSNHMKPLLREICNLEGPAAVRNGQVPLKGMPVRGVLLVSLILVN
jgi:hypothetical protein